MLNILIPMAGRGTPFKEAGYAFPKPIIDIGGKTMIEIVIANLRPEIEHRFVFICQREHYEKYDLSNIFKRATDNKFETILLNGATQGAACTTLTAITFIDNNDELIIANSDQYIDYNIDSFINSARKKKGDGYIMTFKSSHPRWSYARIDKNGKVLEVAEKKVISDQATVGIYYFKKGGDFINGARSMIEKNIRYNNEFYICPVYNELLLDKKQVYVHEVPPTKVHGLGTPEDLTIFNKKLELKKIKIKSAKATRK